MIVTQADRASRQLAFSDVLLGPETSGPMTLERKSRALSQKKWADKVADAGSKYTAVTDYLGNHAGVVILVREGDSRSCWLTSPNSFLGGSRKPGLPLHIMASLDALAAAGVDAGAVFMHKTAVAPESQGYDAPLGLYFDICIPAFGIVADLVPPGGLKVIPEYTNRASELWLAKTAWCNANGMTYFEKLDVSVPGQLARLLVGCPDGGMLRCDFTKAVWGRAPTLLHGNPSDICGFKYEQYERGPSRRTRRTREPGALAAPGDASAPAGQPQ